MENWWVPGLQIGYEHSFVHQVADFLEGLAKGKPASPTSATRWRRNSLRRGAAFSENAKVGNGGQVAPTEIAGLDEIEVNFGRLCIDKDCRSN